VWDAVIQGDKIQMDNAKIKSTPNKRSKLSIKTKDSFRKYGIKTYNIETNGKDWNKYQFIERKGDPIAILSSRYQILPNEHVIEKADDIEQRLRCQTIVFDDRQWFSKYEVHEHVMASEIKYSSRYIIPNSILFAISQSGESADILEAVSVGKEKNATILSMVNSKICLVLE